MSEMSKWNNSFVSVNIKVFVKQKHYEQGYNLEIKSMIYVDYYSVMD